AGNRVRVTAQLIDGESGNHLWAERYDRDLEDIFEVQNELSMTLAAAILPALSTAELRRAQTKKPENIGAWDLYQRGVWHLSQRNRDDSIEAIKLFEQAMEMDPAFGPAYSGFAWAYQINTLFGYLEIDPQKAMSAAIRGVSLDEDDPFAHFALAQVHSIARDHTAACEDFEHALKLNPSFCDAYHRLAYTMIHMGRPQEALPHLESCLRMQPNDVVVGICYSGYCLAWLYLRDFEQAVTWGYKSIRRPTIPWRGYVHLISALGHSGDEAGAQEVLAKLSRLHPEVTVSFWRKHNFTTNAEMAELLLDGLRKAGLPE
ncbi:MAG: tetratricopeptide repeat protein, partial [Hyphomicrobium sp.]